MIVEYPSGARASLDLCMFAENSLDNEHVVVVGDEGKLESLLPSGELRFGRREDFGRHEVWGQNTASERGVAVRRIRDTNIKYLGHHFGASYVEHQKFAHAVRNGLPPEIPLEEGLRAVASGLAAHRSIDAAPGGRDGRDPAARMVICGPLGASCPLPQQVDFTPGQGAR